MGIAAADGVSRRTDTMAHGLCSASCAWPRRGLDRKTWFRRHLTQLGTCHLSLQLRDDRQSLKLDCMLADARFNGEDTALPAARTMPPKPPPTPLRPDWPAAPRL